MRQTKTPFPAVSPSALTTQAARDGHPSRRSAPRPPHDVLGEAFEPSIRAAAALGPKTETPPRRSWSATPATSGASGPITTRSVAERVRASSSRPSPSSARIG